LGKVKEIPDADKYIGQIGDNLNNGYITNNVIEQRGGVKKKGY
jgi:hypothetical protein